MATLNVPIQVDISEAVTTRLDEIQVHVKAQADRIQELENTIKDAVEVAIIYQRVGNLTTGWAAILEVLEPGKH